MTRDAFKAISDPRRRKIIELICFKKADTIPSVCRQTKVDFFLERVSLFKVNFLIANPSPQGKDIFRFRRCQGCNEQRQHTCLRMLPLTVPARKMNTAIEG
jgi:hypothetical protein